MFKVLSLLETLILENFISLRIAVYTSNITKMEFLSNS